MVFSFLAVGSVLAMASARVVESGLWCDCARYSDPVCMDGKTYNNECEARCERVTGNWTQGPCPPRRKLRSVSRRGLLDVTLSPIRSLSPRRDDFFTNLGKRLEKVMKKINGEVSDDDLDKIKETCYHAKIQAIKDARDAGFFVKVRTFWRAAEEFSFWFYEMAYTGPTIYAAYHLPGYLFTTKTPAEMVKPYTMFLPDTINNSVNEVLLPLVFATPPILRAAYLIVNLISSFVNLFRG